MKSLSNYINESIITIDEGLVSWFKAFFLKVNKNNLSRINKNQVNMLDMDIDKLSIQKTPISLSELPKENLDIYKNPKVGYPDTYRVIQNRKNYTDTTDDKLYIYQFIYNGDKPYDAAIILYDSNIENRKKENYCNILAIEYNKLVDNPSEVLPAIFNQFANICKTKEKTLEGFTISENRMTKIGEVIRILKFKETEDSENSTNTTNKIYEKEI